MSNENQNKICLNHEGNNMLPFGYCKLDHCQISECIFFWTYYEWSFCPFNTFHSLVKPSSSTGNSYIFREATKSLLKIDPFSEGLWNSFVQIASPEQDFKQDVTKVVSLVRNDKIYQVYPVTLINHFASSSKGLTSIVYLILPGTGERRCTILFNYLKAPYSSKMDIFVQERFR